MTIKVFSLISGAELIAEVISEFDSTYILGNPAHIDLHQNEDGSMGISVAAFMPYAADNISLNKSSVSAYCTPVEALAAEYKSRFEEPPLIQVPSTKKLII